MGTRGQKNCPECDTENGVRSYHCKKCDYEFPMKKRRKGKRRKVVDNWRELRKGDKVKVVGGSGPYYIDPESGDRTYLSERGEYVIKGIDRMGIKVYGNGGYTFLYMGNKKKSPLVDNVYRSPHKLILIT